MSFYWYMWKSAPSWGFVVVTNMMDMIQFRSYQIDFRNIAIIFQGRYQV